MNYWKPITFGILIGLLSAGLILLISSRPTGIPIQLLPPPTPEPIVIYITGAVKTPGVYSLPINSRVKDAITVAGGLLSNADENSINLATKLKDRDKILIPLIKQNPQVGTPGSPTGQAPAKQQPTLSSDNPININSADANELDSLPGIGPEKAQQIINYREKSGPFLKPEDIENVGGIGPLLFDKIKGLITVGP
jgi:competence protein ComEA